jgi:hypothetical protein
MSDLAYDIEQLYIEGHSPRMISIMLECPIEQVYGWLETTNLQEAPEACYIMDYDPYSTINS